MAQQTLKEITYEGSKVIVEVARRDAVGNVINTTYVTSGSLETALNGKQDTISAGTGITISNNTVSTKIASASQVGGISVGNGLSVTAQGELSANAQGWSTITNKPFTDLASTDFEVTSNVLYVKDTKFLTVSAAASGYVALSTYNTYIGTTAPNTYQAKHANLTSISGLSTSSTGLIKMTNGVASLDTNTYLTSHQSLANYYQKSETYSKAEVEALVNAINSFEYVIASSLPTLESASDYAELKNKIYLIPSTVSRTQNAKDEFIAIRTGTEGSYSYAWEQIGTTSVDLSNYIQSSAVVSDGAIIVGDGSSRSVKASSYSISNNTLADSSSTVPTSAAVYSALSGKQATLSSSNAGTGISISNQGVISSVIAATDVILDY